MFSPRTRRPTSTRHWTWPRLSTFSKFKFQQIQISSTFNFFHKGLKRAQPLSRLEPNEVLDENLYPRGQPQECFGELSISPGEAKTIFSPEDEETKKGFGEIVGVWRKCFEDSLEGDDIKVIMYFKAEFDHVCRSLKLARCVYFFWKFELKSTNLVQVCTEVCRYRYQISIILFNLKFSKEIQ